MIHPVHRFAPRRFAGAVLLFCAVSAPNAAAQFSDQRPAPPTVRATGSATVSSSPDQLELWLSVVSEGDTARDALEANSAVMRDVMTALEREDVAEDQIETTNVSLQPRYSQSQRGEQPRISGYRVENAVKVTTPDLERAGDIIEAAVSAGANSVQSLSFGLSDPTAKRQEAIGKAVEAARAEAEAAAKAAGVRLLGPLRIEIEPGGYDGPRPMARMMAMDGAGGAPPVNPGQVEVGARVTVEYRISQDGAAPHSRGPDWPAQIDLDSSLYGRILEGMKFSTAEPAEGWPGWERRQPVLGWPGFFYVPVKEYASATTGFQPPLR